VRLLVLGGTAFVGRYIVEAALARGHDVTLFNRGQTNRDLFPGVERRKGDRDGSDLESLRTGEWDALVDVNGYVPRHVRDMAAVVGERVPLYCFISTGSVYAEFGPVDTDEDSALIEFDGPYDEEERTDRSYGPLLVLGVGGGRAAYPDGSLIVRPGIVAGPHDPTDRFTYWVRRAARGGPMLAPPRPEQPVQLVHAQDQAEFIVTLLERGHRGTFNTVGPDDPMTFADMIGACAKVAETAPDVVWTEASVLRANQLVLPLAMPASGKLDGVFRRSNARAKSVGFVNRSIEALAADTLAWDRTRAESDWRVPLLPAADEARIAALSAP
jgi:2'-hydroxyisoflavone reductase